MTDDLNLMSPARPSLVNPTPEPSTAPSPSNDGTLRAKAREAIQAGKLPDRHPENTWGGPGEGAVCTICGAPVRPDELELELEFARGGNGCAPDRHHVHTRCFMAWKLELQDRDRVLPGTIHDVKMPGLGSEATNTRESA